MELLKKKNSKFYWYDFTVRGERYRGSTKETNITRAGKIAALKLTQAIEGHDPLDKKAPTLLEFSSRFVEWAKTARLELDTRRYYLNGWRLVQTTQLQKMRLNRITAAVVEGMRFSGSPANGNNAPHFAPNAEQGARVESHSGCARFQAFQGGGPRIEAR